MSTLVPFKNFECAYDSEIDLSDLPNFPKDSYPNTDDLWENSTISAQTTLLTDKLPHFSVFSEKEIREELKETEGKASHSYASGARYIGDVFRYKRH
jgi:hypothetical protein